MIALVALVVGIGWPDGRAFRCPDQAPACIDPARLPDMPAGVHAAMQGPACTSLDHPGGIICDTAIATAVMAACPVGTPACWRATWLRALAPNLEHGLDALVRAYPRAR